MSYGEQLTDPALQKSFLNGVLTPCINDFAAGCFGGEKRSVHCLLFHFLFIRLSCSVSVSVSVAGIFSRTLHVQSIMTVTALVTLLSEWLWLDKVENGYYVVTV